MLYYKMNSETIVMCVVALILGMLLAHMLKSVCGCKVVEGGSWHHLTRNLPPSDFYGCCECFRDGGQSEDYTECMNKHGCWDLELNCQD